MKHLIRNTWFVLFVAIALLHLLSDVAPWPKLGMATKPLLLPLLMAFYYTQSRRQGSHVDARFMLGLLFSFVGDVLLMFQEQQSLFFILGLIAFLAAHICYILFFVKRYAALPLKKTAAYTFTVAVYGFGMMVLLYPHLGGMFLPVLLYTAVISTMLWCALHTRASAAKPWFVAGALLFVASDSLLAISKFYHPFAMAGLAIMLTYCAAQLFLTIGALQHQ